MKKLFVSLLALMVFASTNAQETITETDWASMDDVVALKSSEFPVGSGVVQIPICIKAHEDFQGATFFIQLPDGFTVSALGTVADPRKANLATGTPFLDGNQLTNGNYKVIAAMSGSTSSGGKAYFTQGSADDDYLFTYISVDLTGKEAREYPMKIVGETQFSKFDETGQPSLTLTQEITTKLVITDEIVLDELDTEAPGTYTGVNVKVKRTISANNWNTICLPFDMTAQQCQEVFGSDVQLARLSGYDYDGESFINVKFTAYDHIDKNVPCIIKISQEDFTEFTLDNVNIEPAPIDELKLEVKNNKNKVIAGNYGTYQNNTKVYDEEKMLLFLSGNKFYFANNEGKTKMKGFRAWFWLKAADSDEFEINPTSKIRISVDGEATSIEGISTVEKVIGGVYSVSGVKVAEDSVEGLPQGVYIVNGKKVFVK